MSRTNSRLSGKTALPSRNGHATPNPLDDRLPSHSPEHERGVLGGLLLQPEQIADVLNVAKLRADHFYSDRHQAIFQVLEDLHRDGKSWDIQIVVTELERRRLFEVIGKDEYLTLVVNSVPHAVLTLQHAGYVKEYSERRRLQQIGDEIARGAVNHDLPTAQIFELARSLLGESQPAAAAAYDGNGQVNWALLSDEDMGMRLASSIKAKPIEWLMPDRIPALAYTLIAGEGKQGKSQLTMAMGALISTGGQWWDGSGEVSQGHVLCLSAEDDAERVIRPRLEALGADLDMITILEARYKRPSKDGKESLIDVEAELSSLEYWQDVFRRVKNPRVLFIDPLPSYIGRGVNDRKNAEVRAVLHPFIRLAASFGITTIGVTHLGKSVDVTKPIANRVLDSIAYVNLARAVHFVAKDPANPDRKLFLPGPCNYSATGMGALAFTLEDREVILADGSTAVVAVAEFQQETVDVDAQEVVSVVSKRKPGPPPSKIRTQMAEWLYEFLKDGRPVLAVDCYNGAAEAFAETKPNPMGFKVAATGRWSKGFNLKRAAETIPELPYPRSGWIVDKFQDSTQNNRWYWQLINAHQATIPIGTPF